MVHRVYSQRPSALGRKGRKEDKEDLADESGSTPRWSHRPANEFFFFVLVEASADRRLPPRPRAQLRKTGILPISWPEGKHPTKKQKSVEAMTRKTEQRRAARPLKRWQRRIPTDGGGGSGGKIKRANPIGAARLPRERSRHPQTPPTIGPGERPQHAGQDYSRERLFPHLF